MKSIRERVAVWASLDDVLVPDGETAADGKRAQPIQEQGDRLLGEGADAALRDLAPAAARAT